MKAFLYLMVMLSILSGCASDETNKSIADVPSTTDKTSEAAWNTSVLTEQSIKKIQQSKQDYLVCISDEMQKHLNSEAKNMDSRHATDKVLKICESSLAKVRIVFLEQNAPEAVANQYLKRTRTQTARKVLQEMMYASAANQQK